MNKQVEELNEQINREFRTDGATLPAAPKVIDLEQEKIALEERKQILNPTAYWNEKRPNTNVTVEEWHNQIAYGIPPKSATKEAKDAVAHHEAKLKKVDGKDVIVIEAPEVAVPSTSEKKLEQANFGDKEPSTTTESVITPVKIEEVKRS